VLAEGLTPRSIVKISLFVLCAALLMVPPVHAAEPLNIVIALDMTRSVAVKAPDQKQEFEKNVAAVARLLAEVPAGSHITTVLGITDRSFAHPSILLSAELSNDPGYFGERLQAARLRMVAAFQERASPRTPTESARGIAPRAAHRSGLEPLDSSGSCHPLKAAACRRDQRVPPVAR
jgi:hypothetical protein